MDNSSAIPSLLAIYLSSCKSGYVVDLCWYDESVCVMAVCFLCRHDGHEANDGEVGCAKDSSGDEENDLRGDGGLQ